MFEEKLCEKLQNFQLPLHDGLKIDRWRGFQCKFADNEEILIRHLTGAITFHSGFNDVEFIKSKIINDEDKLPETSKVEEDGKSTQAAANNLIKGKVENSFLQKQQNEENREKILGFCVSKNSILDEIFEKHEAMVQKFKAPETANIKFHEIKASSPAFERQSGKIDTTKNSMDEEQNVSSSSKSKCSARKRKREIEKITVDQLENLFKSLDECIQADKEVSQNNRRFTSTTSSYRRHPSNITNIHTVEDSAMLNWSFDKQKVPTTTKISHQNVVLNKSNGATHQRVIARSNTSNYQQQSQDDEIENIVHRMLAKPKIDYNDEQRKHSSTVKLRENLMEDFEDFAIDNLSESFSQQEISEEFELNPDEWQPMETVKMKSSRNVINPQNVSSRSFNFSVLSDKNLKKISENGKTRMKTNFPAENSANSKLQQLSNFSCERFLDK